MCIIVANPEVAAPERGHPSAAPPATCLSSPKPLTLFAQSHFHLSRSRTAAAEAAGMEADGKAGLLLELLAHAAASHL